MEATQIGGWIGSALIVSAYFLNSFKFVESHGLFYQLFNLFGAAGVGINVFTPQTMPAFFLELFWGGIALSAMIWFVKGRRKRKKHQLSFKIPPKFP